MKPRIHRHVSGGWAIVHWPYLIGTTSSFAKACAIAAAWQREGWYVI